MLVDGQEIWSEKKTESLSPATTPSSSGQDSILPVVNPFSDHKLDLSSFAGRTINLTLRVNPLGDTTKDWANWVEPMIVVGTSESDGAELVSPTR